MPLETLADERLRTILGELKRRFEDLYRDRLVKMILYGSHARGDARGIDSDIDVLVVLKGPVEHCAEVQRTIEIVAGLSLDFDTVVQCLFLEDDRFARGEGPLVRNVRREGIEL